METKRDVPKTVDEIPVLPRTCDNSVEVQVCAQPVESSLASGEGSSHLSAVASHLTDIALAGAIDWISVF